MGIARVMRNTQQEADSLVMKSKHKQHNDMADKQTDLLLALQELQYTNINSDINK